MNTSHLIHACALSFALALTACGDDSSSSDDTGAATTGTDTADTVDTNDPTTGNDTNDPTTGNDTNDPTTGNDTDDTTATTDATTGDETSGDSTGEAAMAEIRVLHLGVNAPGVDVFANGDGPVVENLEFRAGTEYLMVPAGDYTFQVSVTGTTADEAVLAPELTLEADTKYTAVAIGDLMSEDMATGLQALPLVDDDADIDAANVRITVVHAAPAVGEVDIWEISDPNAPTELLADVPFGAAATLPDIPAGALEIGLDTNDDGTPDVTFSVPDAGLGGLQVNAYANNDADGGVALIAQLPDGTVLPIPANG
jgi:hypothetical protein